MNPIDLIVIIALPAASLILGLFVPLAAGMAIAGLVIGLVSRRWGGFLIGMLLLVFLVALALLGRSWAVSIATPEQLVQGNQNAGIVFGTLTPFGVLLGLVLVGVTLARQYVGGAAARRRESR
ncbi:MAG: hypothetical protein ABIR17_04425 [Pseudolysinimonas sp.]|uniref:hypothetical protein n=1 Tax=Pseudolysinimonas sp. TaxID=2680009 RepID=UPI0032630E79